MSAALVLARSCRRVVICDTGKPRNWASRGVHGFLTRDGVDPSEFRALARADLDRYDVTCLGLEVVSVESLPAGDCPPPGLKFQARLADGRMVASRKLLLATGIQDTLPEQPGFAEYYGRGVYHCPYCDGWSHRGQRLVAYGEAHAATGLALALRTWSDRVTVCTDGTGLDERDRQRLGRNGIDWRESHIERLAGRDGMLTAVRFRDGGTLDCDAVFFNTSQAQQSCLARELGCEMEEERALTHGKQRTCVPGLFLAGDADGDVQFVIVAAAEGARAAVAINRELQDEDRGEVDAG